MSQSGLNVLLQLLVMIYILLMGRQLQLWCCCNKFSTEGRTEHWAKAKSQQTMSTECDTHQQVTLF